MAMTDEQLTALRRIESDIRCSAELDWEVTLGGNGTNAHEAINVIDAVLGALDLYQVHPTEDEVNEYEETYG